MNESQLIRFLAKIEMPPEADGCWNWTAGRDTAGYGRFHLDTNQGDRSAHLVSYEHWIGPIPEGLQLDHLCRNRKCCNPTHLEAVTQRVNVLRGMSPNIVAFRTNVCTKGHSYTPENTIHMTRGRVCRICYNKHARERHARRMLFDPAYREKKRVSAISSWRNRNQQNLNARNYETSIMSTRSAIIQKTTDGYAGIYCHSDGYVEGVGLTLHNYYQDVQQVADLIALGDISTLGKRVHPIDPAVHSFDQPEGGYVGTTRAYGRDRGEASQGPATGNTANKVADQIGHDGHVYVFDDRSGSFAWTHNDMPLDYALEQSGLLEPAVA